MIQAEQREEGWRFYFTSGAELAELTQHLRGVLGKSHGCNSTWFVGHDNWGARHFVMVKHQLTATQLMLMFT